MCGCRGVESDIEQVMQKHREMQDQIAEDMLQSVSALKQNSLAARSTIEKDSEVQGVGVGWDVAGVGWGVAGVGWGVAGVWLGWGGGGGLRVNTS